MGRARMFAECTRSHSRRSGYTLKISDHTAPHGRTTGCLSCAAVAFFLLPRAVRKSPSVWRAQGGPGCGSALTISREKNPTNNKKSADGFKTCLGLSCCPALPSATDQQDRNRLAGARARAIAGVWYGTYLPVSRNTPLVGFLALRLDECTRQGWWRPAARPETGHPVDSPEPVGTPAPRNKKAGSRAHWGFTPARAQATRAYSSSTPL